MTLSSWAASAKRSIFEDLLNAQAPKLGECDLTALKEAFAKSKPEMGTTVFKPQEVLFEFIFPGQASGTQIVSVSVVPPERIVFLPVPGWVIEQIWQGDVLGSYHFATDAAKLVEAFLARLDPQVNEQEFAARPATRRE